MTDGTKLVNELLRLHDNLEASRGVQHEKVKKVRKEQTERYWALRARIAKAMDDSNASARFYGRERRDAPAA